MKPVQVGQQAFISDGGEEFGAVRHIAADGSAVIVYVENAGEFAVSPEAVLTVHDQKVIFDCAKLDPRLREAIGHAHDAELPGF